MTKTNSNYQQQPNSCALFKNHKPKSEKSPQLLGDLVIERALLQDLLDADPAAETIKLSVSAWEKTTATGNAFIAARVSKPYIGGQQ
jgi:hypothetical protein